MPASTAKTESRAVALTSATTPSAQPPSRRRRSSSASAQEISSRCSDVCQRSSRPKLGAVCSWLRQCESASGRQCREKCAPSPDGKGSAPGSAHLTCSANTSGRGSSTAPAKEEPCRNLEPVINTILPSAKCARTCEAVMRIWHASTTTRVPAGMPAGRAVVNPVLLPATCRTTHAASLPPTPVARASQAAQPGDCALASLPISSMMAAAASVCSPAASRAGTVKSSTSLKPASSVPEGGFLPNGADSS
mmetsp:Transcript_8527/g.21773  ORF Transcript_8527/g.21773 Transcript_8527/m.21773 type:complete len:249 (-) Transcript_8527:2356-3102(-)